MPFTTNLSGTTELADSIVLSFDQSFIIANAEESMFTEEGGLIAYKRDIGAKSIALTKYAQLALATTPLAEVDDAESKAMDDSVITLTPAEYGNVVTKTNLASLQTGGKADTAAAVLVGKNMGRTMNKLAIMAGEASSNVLNTNGDLATALLAGDVMTRGHMNLIYNKLARASVPTIAGAYVAIMHDDVIFDLRAETGEGSWMDVAKYATPETIMKNEVGMIAGFRVLRNNDVTLTDNGGSATVDEYKSMFFGFNGLGLATSQDPSMHLSGPFDKLGRFVNIGWYGVFKFEIIDSDAVWVSSSSSSVGVNAT